MSDKLSSFERKVGVSETYAAATGYFLLAFSYVEEEMDHAIWTVLKVGGDTGGFVITTAIRDFGQRMLLLAKLSKARLDDDKNRNDIIRALQFVNDRRVDLVHGTLLGSEPPHETVYFQRGVSERTQIRQIPSKFTAEYLCDLTDYTLQIAEAIMKFRNNLCGATSKLPSLDKRPELQAQEDD